MNKIRACIIGMGTISSIHLGVLEAMSDRVEIVGVCDCDPTRLAPFDHRYATFTSVEALLDQVAVDVAHVCVPHATHLPVIEQLIARGAAVFTEKPVTASVAQADRLAELAGTPSCPPIGVCFQNRYNPTFEALLAIVRAGDYGPVQFVRGTVPWQRTLTYYEAAPWRGQMAVAGGGVMMNQAIHTLDQMLLVGGGQARSVRGMVGRLTGFPIEVEDTAVARMVLANGVEALFQATVAHHVNEPVELKVYCAEATLVICDGVLTARMSDGTEQVLGRDTTATGAKFYYGTGHGAAIDAFYQAVVKGTEDFVRVADAIPAIYAIDAIRRSSEQGQAEVDVQQVDAGDLGPRWAV